MILYHIVCYATGMHVTAMLARINEWLCRLISEGINSDLLSPNLIDETYFNLINPEWL